MHKQTLASNIKEEMMLEVVEIIDVALLLLHHIQVLTLQAPAVRPASLPRTVALAVLLEAVALQALALLPQSLHSQCDVQLSPNLKHSQ
jgi:hypothetical protein